MKASIEIRILPVLLALMLTVCNGFGANVTAKQTSDSAVATKNKATENVDKNKQKAPKTNHKISKTDRNAAPDSTTSTVAESKSGNSSLALWLAIAGDVGLLLLAGYCFKAFNELRRTKENKKEETHTPIEAIMDDLQRCKKRLDALEADFAKYDDKLHQPKQYYSHPYTHTPVCNEKPKSPVAAPASFHERTGYFGINKQNLFNEFYTINGEKSVFNVSFDNKGNGSYTIDEEHLKRLRSYDVIEQAVSIEYENCTKDNFRIFEITHSGEVEKKPDSLVWTITRPLHIKLKK